MLAQVSPVEIITGNGMDKFLESPKNDLQSSMAVCTTPTRFTRHISAEILQIF
jgi:hypothetical protein